MKRVFMCLLALCCAALLGACEWSAVPLEGDKPPVGSPPEPQEITGQLAEYTAGHVDMALTIPDGWAWETVEEDGQAGLRFRKTDDGTVSFRLTCWLNGYGICGTGVTEQDLTLSGGQMVWQYTEAAGDNVWVNIAFQDTPGSYVCMPDPSGVMDSAAWDGCRDEVLAILGTAQLGRGILTEQEAVELAKTKYDGDYDTAWGRYDVTTGCWAVTFSQSTLGGGNAVIRYVGSDGKVSDEAVWMCIEGPMEDTVPAN